MSPSVPGPYAIVLLGIATFRMWRIVAEDTILDRLRAWVLRLGSWQEGHPTPAGYRKKLAEFLTCPWCCGAWIGAAWWIAWQITASWTLWLAALLTLWTITGATASVLGLVAEERDGS